MDMQIAYHEITNSDITYIQTHNSKIVHHACSLKFIHNMYKLLAACMVDIMPIQIIQLNSLIAITVEVYTLSLDHMLK